jgi:sulfotransferase family protein
MYVFCVGMYRSCSTWQYEVACHLLEHHLNGERLGFWQGDQFAAHAASGVDPARWYVLKSHDADDRLGAALREGRALGFYAYRDLRDVAYSLIFKLRADFDEVIVRRRFLHAILDSDGYWTAQPNLLCQRYEALMADPVEGVEEMAAHLGLTLAPGEAEAIAAEYSLEANQCRTAELTRRLGEKGIDLREPDHALLYDPHSLLHWNHLRQGRVGGWREDATPAERVTLAEICGAWLITRGYDCDTDWAIPPERLRERIAAQRRALAELETQLAEARAALASAHAQLALFEALGPFALGIARTIYRLSHRLAGFHRLKRLSAGDHGVA